MMNAIHIRELWNNLISLFNVQFNACQICSIRSDNQLAQTALCKISQNNYIWFPEAVPQMHITLNIKKNANPLSLNTIWQTILFSSLLFYSMTAHARRGVYLIPERDVWSDMKMSDGRWRAEHFSWLHHFGHEWILIAFYFANLWHNAGDQSISINLRSALGSVSPGGRWSFFCQQKVQIMPSWYDLINVTRVKHIWPKRPGFLQFSLLFCRKLGGS